MAPQSAASEPLDEGANTWDCTICDEDFTSSESCKSHMSKIHYVCPHERCGHQFESRDLQARHWIITQHRYYCHVCNIPFKTAGGLENHECLSGESEYIPCVVCRMIAPDEQTYVLHWQQMRMEQSHYINQAELAPEHTTCRHCLISSQNTLKACCADCHYHFRDAEMLALHKKNHRNIPCTTCALKFHSVSDMLHHVEGGHCTATAQSRIKEHIMDLKESQSPMLPKVWGHSRRHQRFKPGQKLYFCRHCEDREFPNLAGLFAYTENSSSCPAQLSDTYFRNIVKRLYGEDIGLEW